MKALTTLALSPLLALYVSADASAHPAPYAHRHVAAPAPVYTTVTRQEPAPVHRRVRRVIVHGGPVVEVQDETSVVVAPAPVVIEQPRRRVVIEEPEPLYAPRFSIGVRGTVAALEGGKIGLSGEENPVMGGIGLSLRTRFTDNVGMELSADYLEGRASDFIQSTIPVSLSLDYHFLPHIRFQPYLLGGISVQFTELEYLGGQYKYDMVELGGHLGAGLELFLTRDISLHADIRGNAIFKNLDSQAKIRDDCISQNGEQAGFCNNVQSADPNDKVNMGIQVMAGLSYHF